MADATLGQASGYLKTLPKEGVVYQNLNTAFSANRKICVLCNSAFLINATGIRQPCWRQPEAKCLQQKELPVQSL